MDWEEGKYVGSDANGNNVLKGGGGSLVTF